MAKDRTIRLEDVTADNWEDVVDLEVADDQEDLVAENAYSLAESKFNPHAIPKAIYAGCKLVGFAMYERLVEEGEPRTFSIYRFMIDKSHQGKGYGRTALGKIIEDIRSAPDCERITICYVPKNKAARKFYASLGFKEIGRDEDGEMIAEILCGPALEHQEN